MAKRLLVASVALVAVLSTLAACSSSESGTAEETVVDRGEGSDGTEPASDEGPDPATGCAGYTAGEDGVIRTFCDGTASVELSVGGDEYELRGGECVTQGGYLSVNIGVVTGSDFTGTKPDYFGSNMPEATGDYGEGDQAFATFAVDGTSYSVPNTTGSHDGDTATFSGTTTDGDIEVTGTVSC